jgi:ankyrin repeat protein
MQQQAIGQVVSLGAATAAHPAGDAAAQAGAAGAVASAHAELLDMILDGVLAAQPDGMAPAASASERLPPTDAPRHVFGDGLPRAAANAINGAAHAVSAGAGGEGAPPSEPGVSAEAGRGRHSPPRPARGLPQHHQPPQARHQEASGLSGQAAAQAASSLTREDMATARHILHQLEPQRTAASAERPALLLQRLAVALSNQVFNASFSGNQRVLEGVFSLPPRLLAATRVQAGMQQPGSLLQPLHMASYNGHTNIVRFLVGRPGVSVNAAAGDHDSPLHKACYNAHMPVVKLLLDAGADANASTPLTMEQRPSDRVSAPRADGAQLRNGRRTPMHYTVFNHELPPSDARTDCVRILLAKVSPPLPDPPAFLRGVCRGLLTQVRWADQHGDPNRTDCWGLTPLHHAAYGGFLDIVRVLHNHSSTDINLQCGDDKCGDTPLMKACWKGHLAVVRLLLVSSASMAFCVARTRPGTCFSASFSLFTSVGVSVHGQSERPSDGIDDLDSPGADKNTANRDGATALHFAADKGYAEIVELLLSAGAPQKADKKGLLPVALAEVISVS